MGNKKIIIELDYYKFLGCIGAILIFLIFVVLPSLITYEKQCILYLRYYENGTSFFNNSIRVSGCEFENYICAESDHCFFENENIIWELDENNTSLNFNEISPNIFRLHLKNKQMVRYDETEQYW